MLTLTLSHLWVVTHFTTFFPVVDSSEQRNGHRQEEPVGSIHAITTTKPQRTTSSNSTKPRKSTKDPPKQQPVQRDPATNRVIVGGGLCPPENDTQNATLAFIHIRKTGGTAIVELVESFKARLPTLQGYRGATLDAPRYDKASKLQRDRYLETTHRSEEGSGYHLPPKFFDPYPFANTATFVVTRDPYDRAISEYYQRLKAVTLAEWEPEFDAHVWKDFDGHHRNDADRMNRWIQEFVAHPFQDAHIPQHHYIWDDGGNRLVTHVLEFARLSEELNALLACYAIPLTLPDKPVNPRLQGSDLTRSNLTRESIRTINTVLQRDFELLGYPMMEI